MRQVTVVGGGLAGLTLGICLRQREVPVTVWEAGRYPRHRVCGEFIHGRGLAVLGRLGLLQAFHAAGAVLASNVRFFSTRAMSPLRRLPEPALCLSRFDMDRLLAATFTNLGGVLRVEERWRGDFGEGVVRATGRRPATGSDKWQWFGLKAHVRDLELKAHLEMHAFDNGYVGLCHVGGGTVNVCGLFRRGRQTRAPANRDWLFGPLRNPLRERLGKAALDEPSVCAVAALPIRERMAANGGCSVGDSLAMIPPVTGNGMSMAFESAELASEPLADYSRGEVKWAETTRRIAAAQELRFRRRLAWARWLNSLLFTPAVRSSTGSFLLRSEILWQVFYRATR